MRCTRGFLSFCWPNFASFKFLDWTVCVSRLFHCSVYINGKAAFLELNPSFSLLCHLVVPHRHETYPKFYPHPVCHLCHSTVAQFFFYSFSINPLGCGIVFSPSCFMFLFISAYMVVIGIILLPHIQPWMDQCHAFHPCSGMPLLFSNTLWIRVMGKGSLTYSSGNKLVFSSTSMSNSSMAYRVNFSSWSSSGQWVHCSLRCWSLSQAGW